MSARELPAPRSSTPPPSQGVAGSREGGKAVVDPYPNWSDGQVRREAEALGAELPAVATRVEVIEILERRRHLVASLDEKVLGEIVAWAMIGVRPLSAAEGGESLAARKEHLVRQIVAGGALRTMRFGGLSQGGLQHLAVLRGIPVRGDESVPVLVDVLKSRESFVEKFHRKRRSLLGHLAERFVGGTGGGGEGGQAGEAAGPGAAASSKRLKHEIEEQGLLAGLTNRLKRNADTYVQEKLDEIEARIDRKLDEIDRRLCDWRDKEIANRIRIIKLTLWASVVISALSLVYMYVKGHLL